ncbi:MAG: hypothetical protein AAFP90_12285 [Planctomycetota bacterium]
MTFFAVLGFLLASYSIVANDAIQTLGTFLSSNAKRPWWGLWLFASSVLLAVLVYGWFANNGDVSYGKLSDFPLPKGGISWLYCVPPLVVLGLTRFGIPVSTTFLILAVFKPANLSGMLTKSVCGYLIAFAIGLVLYLIIAKPVEKRLIKTRDNPPATYWVVLQWVSTAFLWSQWLIHDLANIFAYLPRQLGLGGLLFAAVVMLILHAVIFARGGGEIQQVVSSKTNTADIRSATIIDFVYGAVLLIFKEVSDMPMSTTWVFLGLLAGREIGMQSMLREKTQRQTWWLAGKDIGKAFIGLLVSVLLALILTWGSD